MTFLYPYVTWLTIFVFVPSIILWALNFRYLKRHARVFVFMGVSAFIWGFGLDITGSTLWHIWSYHDILGPSLFRLPLEEYLLLLTFPQEVTTILLVLRKRIYG